MKDFPAVSEIETQILEAFNTRHATKVFDDTRKIPDQQFNTILEAARLSPTSFGLEPWQLLVIQSPEKRELFREFSWGANGAFNGSKGQLGTASHFAIFLSHTEETMAPESDYLKTHLKEVKHLPDDITDFLLGAYKKFRDEDFGIKGERQTTDWSARQAYIALGNMMSVAALLGIDSCPIEGFDLKKTTDTLEHHFGIDPKKYKPAVMVAFGYRADEPPFAKTRREMDQVVSWF